MSELANNSILNIQTYIKNLNQIVDQRVNTLKTKISKLKQELQELEKLHPTYGNLHHMDNLILGGKIHTQIVIDAV